MVTMRTTIKICENCAAEYNVSRSDAKYCTKACKQNAYNKRERLKTKYGIEDPLLIERFLSLQKSVQEAVDAKKRGS
jgi:hypothetical protein